MDKGIYDDFLFDLGWTVSGNATGGIWERGNPNGTTSQGNPVNPADDVLNDCGDEAYVTGNNGVTSSDDDVDGGTTILTSPVFDLTGYVNPFVYFSRWKRLSINSTDTVFISISNGTTTAHLESLTAFSTGSSSWVNKNFKISSYVPITSTMTFKMEVSDKGTDNTNEGALDKFYVLDSTNNNSVQELAKRVEVKVFPNPLTDRAVIQVLDQKTQAYSLILTDVYGRVVRTMKSENGSNQFVVDRKDLQSGIYF
jgi:hypothetical protein